MRPVPNPSLSREVGPTCQSLSSINLNIFLPSQQRAERLLKQKREGKKPSDMPYLITQSFWKAFPPSSLLVLSSHRGLYSRLAHWSIQGQGARASAGHHRCSGGKAGKNSSKKWASLDVKQEIQVQKNYPELLRKGGGWLSMIHLPGTNCP